MAATLKTLEARLLELVAINRRAVAAANDSHAQAQQVKAQITLVKELMGGDQ